MNAIFALLAGLIFGLGLIVSGMSDPAKVLGFLDLAGLWNPSLALVMAGAIPVAAIGFVIAARRRVSVTGAAIAIPQSHSLDRRLLVGSLLFGAGWGMSGICPGPALILLSTGVAKGVGFFVAMLLGMALYELWLRRGEQQPSHASNADA